MAGNHDGTPVDLRSSACFIEFIGGPFDGHSELFLAPAEQLPEDLMWFVGPDVFHNLDGKRERGEQPITSIAVYERKRRRGVWCYLFVGAMSPKKLRDQFAHGDFCFGATAHSTLRYKTKRGNRYD